MKINHELLLKNGFVRYGDDEGDPYYKFVFSAKYASRFQNLSGSFDDSGNFDLYGFGYIDAKRLEEIMDGYKKIIGQPISAFSYFASKKKITNM